MSGSFMEIDHVLEPDITFPRVQAVEHAIEEAQPVP